MKRKGIARLLALALTGTMVMGTLTGCTFGFASDPDDPNEVEEEIPIDTSVDTYEYRTDLKGTEISVLNTKAEIQVALEEIAVIFEEKTGIHVEIMPVTDGDSPYTKVVSLYNAGNPPTLSILDTTDVVAAGIEKPVSLAKEDWSLGAHQLQYVYETYDGTTDGAAQVIEQIKSGELNLRDYDRMNGFLDLFDILKKYNVAKGDPLGADYDEMAIDLADGKTAIWLNGNWAWPNLKEAGADNDDEYGFLPYFMSNDENDFANQKIQGSASKQVMMDGQMATEDEKAAAKEFLNWLVFSELGQQLVVYRCNIIPPFQNNPYEPTDPLSRSIYEHVQNGETFSASAIVPNDHWSILGGAMQKYLADRCDREELIELIEAYWAEQE